MQPKPHTTVAIVDDDHFLRESLRDFFDAMGIDSVVHGSADAFLASGDIARVQCVLADLKIEFAVGKPVGADLAQIAAQLTANFFRQIAVCIARKYFDVAGYAHFDFGFRISDFGLFSSSN